VIKDKKNVDLIRSNCPSLTNRIGQVYFELMGIELLPSLTREKSANPEETWVIRPKVRSDEGHGYWVILLYISLVPTDTGLFCRRSRNGSPVDSPFKNEAIQTA